MLFVVLLQHDGSTQSKSITRASATGSDVVAVDAVLFGMVIELFDDPQDLAPIFEVGGEKIDVDDDINQRNIRHRYLLDIQVILHFLALVRGLQFQLASDHFVEFLEDPVLGHGGVLLALDLDDLKHPF